MHTHIHIHAATRTEPDLLGADRAEGDFLTQQVEVRFVSGETQHHEISVQAVETMAGVWVKVRQSALTTNVLCDLVLSLTGHIGTRENHLKSTPVLVLVHLASDKVALWKGGW
jgi:hypothetical protein